MKRSLYQGLRMLAYSQFKCDDREHFECAQRHPAGPMRWEAPPGCEIKFGVHDPCPTCGGEIQVRPERPMMRQLALHEIRTSLFPYRLYAGGITAPTMTKEWWWRGRRFLAREVSNPMADEQ